MLRTVHATGEPPLAPPASARRGRRCPTIGRHARLRATIARASPVLVYVAALLLAVFPYCAASRMYLFEALMGEATAKPAAAAALFPSFAGVVGQAACGGARGTPSLRPGGSAAAVGGVVLTALARLSPVAPLTTLTRCSPRSRAAAAAATGTLGLRAVARRRAARAARRAVEAAEAARKKAAAAAVSAAAAAAVAAVSADAPAATSGVPVGVEAGGSFTAQRDSRGCGDRRRCRGVHRCPDARSHDTGSGERVVALQPALS